MSCIVTNLIKEFCVAEVFEDTGTVRTVPLSVRAATLMFKKFKSPIISAVADAKAVP